MTASSTLARLQEALDKTHALALLRRAIATPSVTGEEAVFAAMMKDELVSIGAEGVTSASSPQAGRTSGASARVARAPAHCS